MRNPSHARWPELIAPSRRPSFGQSRKQSFMQYQYRACSVFCFLIALQFVGAGCSRRHEPREIVAGVPLVAFRLAFEDSSPGRQRVRIGERVVYLAPGAVLADADISGATTWIASGVLFLELRLRAEAAARLADDLAPHVGDYLALVLSSRVQDAVPIVSPVGGRGALTVNTGLTGRDAEQFAESVRKRWPPQSSREAHALSPAGEA
jgi:hypothetical protein